MSTASIGLTHEDHTAHAQTNKNAHAHHGHGKGKRVFTLHFVEMTVSMMVGMMIGGALGVSHVPDTTLKAVLWLVVMTLPMIGWMRIRGMSWRQGAEMSLGMVAPTAAALVLFSAGLIEPKAVNGIEHGSMIPGMLAVMLVRRKEYGL